MRRVQDTTSGRCSSLPDAEVGVRGQKRRRHGKTRRASSSGEQPWIQDLWSEVDGDRETLGPGLPTGMVSPIFRAMRELFDHFVDS